ncbi:response regulator [Rhizobium sp. NPDC090275]|uniref:response regulator n=1 Tax=Rhizobium sp. NPDC090275 TaxID=3364498 RepID=UPI00383A7AE3
MCERTVLIVEDELLIRMVLADALFDQGYDVLEAGNVIEAVAIIGQKRVDAVITDVDMPGGFSGLDLLRMMSTNHANVPVIVASGGHQLRQDDMPVGAVFVPKPYSVRGIVSMVGEMICADKRRHA